MANHNITYYCFDLVTLQPLGDFPFVNVTWGQKLNDAGQFSGELLLRDKRVQALDPYNGTKPGRTLLAIDVDGDLAWLGIIWTRRYQSTTGKLTFSGSEIWSYFGCRFLGQDYTNIPGTPPSSLPGAGWWSTNAVDPQFVAAAVIADVLGQPTFAWTNAGTYGTLATYNSSHPFPGTALAWLGIFIAQATPSAAWIAPTYPLSQHQSPQSVVSTLASSGYGVGFDFGIDPSWSGAPGSTPQATLNLAYPRRGRIAGSTGLTIDAAIDTEYLWPEDSSQSMNSIAASASSSGNAGVSGTGLPAGTSIAVQDGAPVAAGYPLLEGTQSYSAISTQDLLIAAARGDLAALEWPVTTPQITLPLFGDPFIGDFIMGDDVRVIMPADDRFQQGFDQYMRIVACDVRVPTEGASTMVVTLNPPIGAAPVPAPPM